MNDEPRTGTIGHVDHGKTTLTAAVNFLVQSGPSSPVLQPTEGLNLVALNDQRPDVDNHIRYFVQFDDDLGNLRALVIYEDGTERFSEEAVLSDERRELIRGESWALIERYEHPPEALPSRRTKYEMYAPARHFDTFPMTMARLPEEPGHCTKKSGKNKSTRRFPIPR